MSDLVKRHIALHKEAEANGAPYCQHCGGVMAYPHDPRPDETGLDDGPWLPGRAPRKKTKPKPPEELRAIRMRAWMTRRATHV